MSIFKRLSNTIAAQIDHVVGEIENHDAVIKASIVDLKQKIAEAHVRRNRISSQVSKIQKEINQCDTDNERWKSRAIESAQSDETKALSCISRSVQCEKQKKQLVTSLEQYQNMELKLSQDITCAEENMRELMQKHELMRARQSSSSALQATQEINGNTSSLLNDTFDRWEVKLQQSEISLDTDPSIDTFEQQFEQKEHEEELQKALIALIENSKGATK